MLSRLFSGVLFVFLLATCLNAQESRFSRLVRNQRSTTGVLVTGEKQIAVWIGPDSASQDIPPLAQGRDTMAFLYGIPDGGSLLKKLSSIANITCIIAIGVGFRDGDLSQVLHANRDMKSLFLHSPVMVGEDAMSDWSAAEMAMIRNECLRGSVYHEIAKLKHLTTLDISGHQLSHEQLREIAKLPQLKSLQLTNTGLTNDKLSLLNALEDLKILAIESSPVNGPELVKLVVATNPKKLSIKNTDASDLFSELLASHSISGHLRALRQIDTFGCRISSAGIGSLASSMPFVNVVTTHQSANDIVPVGDARPQAIREHRSVHFLIDRLCEAVFSGQKDDRGKIKLTRVEIRQRTVPIDDWIMSCIGLLNGVTHLGIIDGCVTDEGVKELESIGSIEVLNLEGAIGVTDASANRIARLPLKLLSLPRTGLTDAGAKKLAACQTLSGIWLDGTHVSDETAGVISRLPNIKYVGLRDCSVTDAGAKALLSSPTIELCDLRGNLIVSDDVAERLRLLNESFNLQELPEELRYEP